MPASCDFKKASGHKVHSPIGRYRLYWINGAKKRASASVLICIGTAFEGTTLSKLVKMDVNLDLQDPNIKWPGLAFCLTFKSWATFRSRWLPNVHDDQVICWHLAQFGVCLQTLFLCCMPEHRQNCHCDKQFWQHPGQGSYQCCLLYTSPSPRDRG